MTTVRLLMTWLLFLALGVSSYAAEDSAPETKAPEPPTLEEVMAAAFQGDAISQYTLAIMYEQRESFTNAVRWLHKAADGGLSEAQFKLGYMATVGLGTPKSMEEAVRWYRAAAEKGHSEAQYNLAVCLEKGLGAKQDLKAAYDWHTKAAMLGDDFAQKALGVCFEKGRGVAADLAEAHKWYSVAAERGNRDAAKLRTLLEPQMTKTQLEAARKLYGEFIAKAPVSVTTPLPGKGEEPRKRAVDFLE